MSRKAVVVYMDENERCRILVNPKHLDNFKNLPNAAVNPDIKSLTDLGIGPDRWIVENGKLSYNDKSKEVSKLTLYDITAENKQLVIKMKDLSTKHDRILQLAKINMVIVYSLLVGISAYLYFRGM